MSGKYVAYPEYKDSGVEWLGSIPEHWMFTELKRYSSVQGGYAFSSDSFVDKGRAVIRIGDIKQDGTVSLDSCKHIKKYGSTQYSQYEVHYGDLLMAMTGATIGKAGWYKEKEPALLNQRVGSFKCRKNHLDYNFFWYVLNSFGYQEYIVLTAFGGAQPNISDAGMVGYQSALPPVDEQQKIANFLDHETAKIDTLIAKQQQLITLLKEKRQAVISHAVTKGLNPNAPMRDSGVEWLGEVPEHWEVKRLKNTSEVVDCRNKTPEYIADGEYFVVRTTNIKNQKLDMNGALYTDNANFKIWTQRGIPPAGSIFFTREAPAGEVCLVPDNLKFCMGQRMMNFICHNSEYTSYLFNFLLSDCLERYIESVSHGSTVAHLRVEQVENIPVLIPPLNEAKAIQQQLSIIKSKYLRLTKEADKTISLMQERRTALISAAVTGKIDVRSWQAPEPSSQKETAV